MCNSPDAVLCHAAVGTPVPEQHPTRAPFCSLQWATVLWGQPDTLSLETGILCRELQDGFSVSSLVESRMIQAQKKIEKNETNQNREKTQKHLENLEILQELPWLTSETVSKITPYSKYRKGLFRYNRLPNGRTLPLPGSLADQRSKVICRVEKYLWVSEEGWRKQQQQPPPPTTKPQKTKLLDMVMKGCNKQRTVLFRLTVLLGECQRSGSTPGWTGKAQSPGNKHSLRLNTLCNIRKYEWLVSNLLGLLGILPLLIKFCCCLLFNFLKFWAHLIFIIYF